MNSAGSAVRWAELLKDFIGWQVRTTCGTQLIIKDKCIWEIFSDCEMTNTSKCECACENERHRERKRECAEGICHNRGKYKAAHVIHNLFVFI